jgi:predicted ester cyclase
MRKYCIPQPQRVRRIEKSFAWIDHRLLRNGYLQVMTHQDQALYLFLVLAGDRHGVSFYRKEKICDALDLDWVQFEVARDRLIELKLIAFEPYNACTPNGYYQVLPVDGQAPNFAGAIMSRVVTR